MNVCTICGHGLHGDRATWTTCPRCEARITARLDAVPDLWAQLSDSLEPTRGHGGPRVSGSTHPPLPAAEQVLNLIGPGGVPTRLYWRYADISAARGFAPQLMPTGADGRLRLALRGIRRHLSWAVQGCDLRLLDDELGKVVEEMTAVTGGAPRPPAVPCPAELPDGDRCDGRMRYDHARRLASCRTCRTELDPTQWLDTWMALGQPDLTA